MGKSKKRTNPGVGVDFRKVKHKVGKKLPKAKNDTKTDFQSRSINLPTQSVAKDRSGAPVSDHNLTREELVSQLSHHNHRTRCNALSGLQQLITAHPTEATRHAALLLEALAAHISDGDQAVRTALLALLRSAILPAVGPAVLAPFMPMLMAHLSAALTHLSADVRYDGLAVLEIITESAPELMAAEQHLQSALAHYTGLLSRSNRGKSVRSQALSGLVKILSSLERFLTAAVAATAAAAAGTNHSSGHSSNAHAAAAAPDSTIAGPLLGARATVLAAPASLQLPSAAGLLQLYHPSSQRLQQQQSGSISPETTLHHQSLQLLNVLFDCWSEAAPGSLHSSPEPEAAQVLVHILACSRLLLGRISTPQLQPAAATVSGMVPSIALYPTVGRKSCAAGLFSQNKSMWVVESAAATVLPRLLAVFPAPDPAAAMTAQLQQLLLRYNLLSMQILTQFMSAGVQWPASAAHTHQKAAAAPAGTAPGGAPADEGALTGSQSSRARNSSRSSSSKGQLALHHGWQERFVNWLSGVLAAGSCWSNPNANLEQSQGPLAAANAAEGNTQQNGKKQRSESASSSVLVGLQCLQQLMPHMPRWQRQQLLLVINQQLPPQQQQQPQAKLSGSVADVSSPIRLACLQLQLQLLLASLSDGVSDPDQESVIAAWVAAAPKLLWECGSGKQQCSRLLLLLLYHAAQLALPGSLVQQQLYQVQPQLAALFATALSASTAAAKGKQLNSACTAAACHAASPVMLGPLANLPGDLQDLAFDALALHTQLQQPILKAVALSCRLSSFNDSAVTRLLDCVLFAAGSRILPQLFLSFAATLLSPAPAGGYVDRVTGEQLYAGFSRHCLLTEVICRWLHSYGPLEVILAALLPLLLQQWQKLSAAAVAGAVPGGQASNVTGIRCCSYSCARLAALALGCWGPVARRGAAAGGTNCQFVDADSGAVAALSESVMQQLPAVLAAYCISGVQYLSYSAGGDTPSVVAIAADSVPAVAPSKVVEPPIGSVVTQCTALLLPLLAAEPELLVLPFLDQVVTWAVSHTAGATEEINAEVSKSTAAPSGTCRADALAAATGLLSTLLQCQALRGCFIQHKQQVEQLVGNLATTLQNSQMSRQIAATCAGVQNIQAAIKLLC